jgi:transcriptional regulator PpsR
VSQFLAPKKSLGNLDVEAAAKLITAAADVALVVDAQGVIRDLSFSSEELAKEGYGGWLGQPWTDTVTIESRPKIEALLRDAGSANGSTWRHVNHPSPRGADVPVLYSAIKLGKTGRVVAVGRNLRPVAILQQRLVEVQQSLERDYARLRHAETRYRLLFQMAAEAIVIVDAVSDKVLEVNPAALKLLDTTAKQFGGKPFADAFEAGSTRVLNGLLNRVRTAGHADEARLRLRAGKKAVTLAVSLFQQDKDAQFIARLSPAEGAGAGEPIGGGKSAAMRALAASPDGFVVTDGEGRLLSANRSFLDVVQCPAEEQVRGKSLSQWLGRPGADLGVLLANLRQHGAVRLFATTLRGELGMSTEVEISAVAVSDPDEPVLGFVIRSVGRRLPPAATERELPRSPEQLTELIGRVPLKDIVRETTDVIERLCIEAALQLTSDNRASAAEMLGLSRQSLYLKLHRYGLGELGAGDQ